MACWDQVLTGFFILSAVEGSADLSATVEMEMNH